MSWLTNPAHHRWLEAHTDHLLDFARGSVLASGGFGYLDDSGVPMADRPTELWITCRMTHTFALGHLLGRPGCAPLVDHGIEAISTLFADPAAPGWFAAIDRDGQPISGAKEAYPHAFVILAAASAVAAGRREARELLATALDVSTRYFWDESEGLVRETFSRDFATCDEYRGVNANMHTVEAYLAAGDVTGEAMWHTRAARITHRVIEWAENNGWRIPEHFSADWQPLLDFNRDKPADPFRPYGATIGHALEWARLALHVAAAVGDRDERLLTGARALFEQAIADGWDVDGAPGFVYTVDWEGRPVVRERMHWVAAEALGAAATLHRATGDADYERWYATWWDYIATHILDRERGSWLHELDAANLPSASVWPGKADIYHAIQATLIPRLPLSPVLAPALARGLLDS